MQAMRDAGRGQRGSQLLQQLYLVMINLVVMSQLCLMTDAQTASIILKFVSKMEQLLEMTKSHFQLRHPSVTCNMKIGHLGHLLHSYKYAVTNYKSCVTSTHSEV
jgi:hypothetical protein